LQLRLHCQPRQARPSTAVVRRTFSGFGAPAAASTPPQRRPRAPSCIYETTVFARFAWRPRSARSIHSGALRHRERAVFHNSTALRPQSIENTAIGSRLVRGAVFRRHAHTHTHTSRWQQQSDDGRSCRKLPTNLASLGKRFKLPPTLGVSECGVCTRELGLRRCGVSRVPRPESRQPGLLLRHHARRR
jgi:hypothetical protein